ncbi:hypothetical protein BKA66DRAFT_109943 [Pyrenochaeta sp. MPI-SDFR-AT-0127]|nr:hypothetical protein BKA66DRAFT_109943 [Pyrenochaeta sp. MPI-SDFR-AT-0127]
MPPCAVVSNVTLRYSKPLIVVEIVMGWYMVRWGAGVHQWQITLGELFSQLFWANTAQVIYCPLSFLVKVAILLQYFWLFAPSRSANKTMWYGAWLTIGVTFVAYTIFMFWTLFYCSPRRMIWFKLTPGGECHDVNVIILSQGAFNMVSDIIVLLLPVSSLWQLRVPLAKKVFITMLFCTGLLACIASAMRIVFTMRITAVISQADVSYNGLFIALWTEAEVSLGFMVACSLCFPRLIQVKGKELRASLSWGSRCFPSLAFKPRKNSSWSEARGSVQLKSKETQGTNRVYERPRYYEEREEQQRQAQAKLQTKNNRLDMYMLPSTTSSSEYSHTVCSQSNAAKSAGNDHTTVDVATLAIQEIPRTVSFRTQEVLLRLEPSITSPQSVEDE